MRIKAKSQISLFFSFLVISFFSFITFSYAQEITILYTGQTHAMLYPCSCPIRQDGGISRRATLVKELRKEYPGLLLLDCGSFTAGGQLDEYTQNIQLDMQRSEVNYQALALMQYDAVGISADEFNFGKDFFLKNAKTANPAYLSVNLDSEKVVPYIIKEINGAKIAIIGLTGLAANQKAQGLKINPPTDQIVQLVSRLKSSGVGILIALSTQGESEDLKLISKVKGIDIIFVGDRPQKEEALTKVGETFILRPTWQGRKLGKLTLKIKDGLLVNCAVQELFVSDQFKDDPDIGRILPRCYSDSNCKEANLTGVCQNPGALNAACIFTKPSKIDLFVINVKDCITCNPELVVKSLQKNFPGLTVKNLDFSEPAAKKMIQDLSLQVLPAYIFPKSVEKEEGFENVKESFLLANDFYLLKPQASGIAYFLNQKFEKGNLDLFFNIFEKDSALLLTTLREFNPRLHFLTAKEDAPEQEEYLRAVCVQKYYPETFWDYLICRSNHIKSAYWEDCLGGLDSSNIKTCARGPQGADLLKENTRLNKQLQIDSGPSYLLDNQQIFASRGVPSKKELSRILKR